LGAIFFDLDNTLIPSRLIYDIVLGQLGFSQESGPYRQARQAVKARLAVGNPSARNRLFYFKALLEADSRFSARRVMEQMDEYERLLEAECRSRWIALGRDELFAALAGRYQLCVVTNENLRTQLLKLRAIDPDAKYFSRILTSEEAGCEKPVAKIFQDALMLAGRRAEECVFVGDSAAEDHAPSDALGFANVQTVEFGEGEPRYPGATIISHLDELRELLP
jgi:putative hydrolase of the HAD superfamily